MNAVNIALEKPVYAGPVTGLSGTVLKQREIPGFSLSECVYPLGLRLSPHRHSEAYLSFVLSGSYQEKYADRECACVAGALRFLPPDELHENFFDSAETGVLERAKAANIELNRYDVPPAEVARWNKVAGEPLWDEWVKKMEGKGHKEARDILNSALELAKN